MLRWLCDTFLDTQFALNRNKDQPCGLKLDIILSSMGSMISRSVGDGHCLLYSVVKAWNDSGRPPITHDEL